MAEYYAEYTVEEYEVEYTEEDTAPVEFLLLPAWPIEKIKPELRVFKTGRSEQRIKYSTPDRVASELQRLFSGERMLVFIVHGFYNNITTRWMYKMEEAILQREKEQVIVVLIGWGGGADYGWIPLSHYSQAAANTEAVGQWLGGVADHLMRSIRPRARQPKPQIWGVGHSLGAHVLGMAGRNSNKSFDRITALDPAGPLFERTNEDKRLHREDATSVDVIHTDGLNAWRPDWTYNHFGTLIPLGTIDFYPNWGCEQPGVGVLNISGSHNRVLDLFTWSIKNPRKFITNQILDHAPGYEAPVKKTRTASYKAQMGYFADKHVQKGLFYLKTNDRDPWQ